MRTSFYFLFWIVIYPVLDIVGVPDGVSFFVALGLVIVLNRILKSTMAETLGFERKLREMPMLGNVFDGDVNGFIKKLEKMRRLSAFGAVYLALATAVLFVCAVITPGSGLIMPLVFAYIALGGILRTVKLSKLVSRIKNDPVPEECMNVACEELRYDYATYYEEVTSGGYKAYLADKPRHFGVFQNFSMVVAIITSLLGVLTLVYGLILTFAGTYLAGMVAGTLLLYGGLAFYYGVTDSQEISRNKGILTMMSRNTAGGSQGQDGRGLRM